MTTLSASSHQPLTAAYGSGNREGDERREDGVCRADRRVGGVGLHERDVLPAAALGHTPRPIEHRAGDVDADDVPRRAHGLA